MKSLYDVLGLSSAATPAEIKKAYFEHAKKYHPDSGNAEEVRKFYEICEAYEILSDAGKRTAYDLTIVDNKIESNLVRDARQPIYRTPEDKLSHPQPVLDESRRKQIFRFRRELLTKAVLRVVGWSLFVGCAAYVYGFILAGPPYLSFICGFFLGLTWALYENFNVNSFMPSLRVQKIATGIRYFIIVICIGYLASLLL